jgi:excinuclease UvrABC nuclease subunit
VTTLDAIFDHRLDFDPAAGDFDAFAKQAPAKWVVYLFADAADQPVQLLCVKNLRASIKRRLGGDELIGPSRKVNYRDLVRRIYWRRVDSAFEADLVYLDIARHIFPASYRGMLGFEPAWFLHVNVDAKFPRYVKTHDLDKQGTLIGPLEDKHAAARLIQLTEDAFDLCRYYNILTESPNARACAYKEMGKCPAPCDGTISLTQYRELVRWSAQTIVDPDEYVRAQTRRMEAAAQDLHFEAAARIKQYVAQISPFGKGAFRLARNFEDFRYLSLQHGPRPGTAKVFLVSPGGVEESAACLADATKNTDFLRYLLDRSASLSPDRDQRGVEAVGVVADHLFRTRKTGGVFLHVDDLEERSFAKAWRELQQQKTPDDSDDEGVVKELQQI